MRQVADREQPSCTRSPSRRAPTDFRRAGAAEAPMLVSQIMTTDPASCTASANLEHALYAMLERDCGFVPVVTDDGRVAGVVTDRDICVAIALHQTLPCRMRVGDVMSQPVFSCRDDDTVLTALGRMTRHAVRRLPAVDSQGSLVGVLSLNDVALATHHPGGPTESDVAETLRAICAHRIVEPSPA
ncbi:MAG TPA: CBS domain-containing protein [Vicinamibacterales bacterium]|nr:CBS domain-containing protein [Vicinamibacterales bacterium]